MKGKKPINKKAPILKPIKGKALPVEVIVKPIPEPVVIEVKLVEPPPPVIEILKKKTRSQIIKRKLLISPDLLNNNSRDEILDKLIVQQNLSMCSNLDQESLKTFTFEGKGKLLLNFCCSSIY